MHREKAEIETDEHRPKVPTPEPLIQQPAGHFGKPEIDGTRDCEKIPADKNVVNVANDKIGIRKLPIDRHRARHEPGDSAYYENNDEAAKNRKAVE